MRFFALCALALLAVFSTDAHGDGAARVALIDTTRLFSPTGLVAWSQARAKLDAEQATYVAAESPDGKTPKKITVPDLDLPPAQRERLRKQFEEIERKANQDHAWATHVEQVLAPIRAAAMTALVDYAKARKIDLVLDRSKIEPAVLVVVAGVDITDAFIKDYNAKAKR